MNGTFVHVYATKYIPMNLLVPIFLVFAHKFSSNSAIEALETWHDRNAFDQQKSETLVAWIRRSRSPCRPHFVGEPTFARHRDKYINQGEFVSDDD